jgi:hypothetical protein
LIGCSPAGSLPIWSSASSTRRRGIQQEPIIAALQQLAEPELPQLRQRHVDAVRGGLGRDSLSRPPGLEEIAEREGAPRSIDVPAHEPREHQTSGLRLQQEHGLVLPDAKPAGLRADDQHREGWSARGSGALCGARGLGDCTFEEPHGEADVLRAEHRLWSRL